MISQRAIVAAFAVCWLALLAIALATWSPGPLVLGAATMLIGYTAGRLT